MNDHEKTIEQLLREITNLRERLDVSESRHKQTEEALRNSDQRYHDLVGITIDFVWEVNQDNVFTYLSPQVEDLLGYKPEELLGKTPFDLMPPEETQRALKVSREIVRSQKHFSGLEVTHLAKDGRQVVVELSAERISNSDGTHLGYRGISRDVTERKEAQQAIKRSHEELAIIQDGMADGFIVATEGDRQIIRANPAVCRMLGYSPEEMLSLSIADIHPAETLSHSLERFDLHAKGHVDQAQNIPVLREDGSVFLADISTNRITYNGRPCLIGFLRNVTERANAVEKLRESEETARALINATTESEFLIEPDGTIVTLNETAAARLGGTVDGLIGQCGYDFMPPGVARARRRQCDHVLNTGRALRSEDERDGIAFYSCIYPVFDHSGKVVRLAIYAQDVTERKKAEEALREEHARLQRNLEASDRELKMIAYEIHDGIAQMLVASIMLLDIEYPDESGADTKKMLAKCIAEVRRLIARVRLPLLDEAGVVAAIRNLVTESNEQFSADVEFDCRLKTERMEPVFENSIYRIVQEGIANAQRHSNSKRIVVRLVEDDNLVKIEIRDWGTGFDVDGVKGKFYGLDGIKERARLLGGHAKIESTPGVGTRILAEFPLPANV